MIILKSNFFNTTTIASVTSGTDTVINMIDKVPATQYVTEGFAGDTLSTTVSIDFPSTQTVDKIVLKNHNLKDFSIYYNNTTTNVFSTDINFSTNSEINHYFTFDTITTITNITLKLNATIIADQEKKIGELVISKLFYDFEADRLPSAKNYTPQIVRKQVRHEMSDGGVTLFNLAEKFKTTLRFEFVPTSTELVFKAIYDDNDPVNFISFETTSSWDGDLFEVNWTGQFNFLKFSANNKNIGFKGIMTLEETPGRN